MKKEINRGKKKKQKNKNKNKTNCKNVIKRMKTYRKHKEIKTLLTDKHILKGRMKKEPKIDQKERKKKRKKR